MKYLIEDDNHSFLHCKLNRVAKQMWLMKDNEEGVTFNTESYRNEPKKYPFKLTGEKVEKRLVVSWEKRKNAFDLATETNMENMFYL